MRSVLHDATGKLHEMSGERSYSLSTGSFPEQQAIRVDMNGNSVEVTAHTGAGDT